MQIEIRREKMLKLVLIFFMIANMAFADSILKKTITDPEVLQTIATYLTDFKNFEKGLLIPEACRLTTLDPANQVDEKSKKCAEKYQKLMKTGNLDINIFFGYEDSEFTNFPVDVTERLSLIEFLTRPCDPNKANVKLCGFIRGEDDAEFLHRYVTMPDGSQKRVNLHIYGASMGTDDTSNRDSIYQKIQSGRLTALYSLMVQHQNIVFYAGHSRDGGGPDFTPAVKTANGEVDYAWYRKNRPGVKRLVEDLKKRTDQDLLLGFFSCDSKKNFKKDIKKVSSAKAAFSTRIVEGNETTYGLMTMMNNLMNFSCENAFAKKNQPFVTDF